METIELHRRFHAWDKDSGTVPVEWLAWYSDRLLSWSDLHQRRRVVVLAEAGSGKTTELEHQAEILAGRGKFAFYATLQDVARDGLDEPLGDAGRERLKQWRESDASAWFFIDSIDEAKLEKIRLESALRKIADGIAGHEGRAFIVLSGRITEWEPVRDAERLRNALPIPEPEEPPTPELRTLIRRLLNREKAPAPPRREEPLIVVMAALNETQMRLYSEAQGVKNVEAFLAALRAANLLDTARRPLDLNWLVRYWLSHGRLGSFAAMVEESLRERVRETDPDRGRNDPLSSEKAMLGLQRVGAALVFGRKKTLTIPDGGAVRTEEALDIHAVLPDWPNNERVALLNRAVFDPAAFGRVRLHNDNQGVVSSYLAAQWLLRLRATNLSARQLHSLLFAQNYGIDLVRPSLQETAAWLSLREDDVAHEVIRREPAVLLSCGDPASLSTTIRAHVLQALAARMCAGEAVPSLDTNSLTRFAQHDIAPTLRQVWDEHSAHDEVRILVLKLIWLGALRECADIAVGAAYGPFNDKSTLYLAGMALLAAGDQSQRRTYAEHIKRHSDTVPTDVLSTAITELFPEFITVGDLIAMLASGVLLDNEAGYSLKWGWADLAARITNPADLDRLARSLLDHTANTATREGLRPGERDDSFAMLLAAVAERRLVISSVDTAPDSAIDAVLFISAPHGTPDTSGNEKLRDAISRLHESAGRRRAAFWRAAQTLSTNPTLNGNRLETVHTMAFAGWPPGLQPVDLKWLLEDGPSRQSPTEQRLAANAAMDLWASQARPNDVLARIEEVAATCPEMHSVVKGWLRPPPESPELEESTRRLAEVMAESEQRMAEQEDWWVAFVDSIRADPDPLSKLLPPSPGTLSQPLVHLWQLLQETNRGRNRYAIESVAPLADLAGEKVADAFALATHRVWREHEPLLRTARPLVQRHQTSDWDILGVAAVSIEAAQDPSWANHLSAEEAYRAAQYATLEINALPPWIDSLAKAWPVPVRDALMSEVLGDLDTPGEDTHRPSLEHIDRAPESVVRVMAEPIWREVESRTDLAPGQLRTLLSIARQGLDPEGLQRAYELAITRFTANDDTATAAQYLGLAASINAEGATQALVDKLATLDDSGKTALVLQVLPQLFGSRLALTPGRAANLDASTLLRLVTLAYQSVRVHDDIDRTNGGVYSPNLRDNAQDARSTAFNLLVEMPGRATFEALRALESDPDFPVAPPRLEALARDRAALDSEATAWAGGAALDFERRWEKEPSTGRELQTLAMQRLEDIQHDLLHSDFAQGPTVSALPNEAAAQSWLADRLRLTQGWSYSVEREPETVDAKKPDIVLTARAVAAKVPVEIKVAESWTLPELEAALESQLCGQYLRARDCREGLLVLLHQKPRPLGWELPDGTYLSFAQVVECLKDRASRIRQESAFGPQPEVAVIDVSTCGRRTRARGGRQGDRAPRNRRAPPRT